MALIDKASLLMVPSTYEAGKLYNVLPSGNRAPDSTDQNSGYDQTRADFDFDRGSNAAATRVNASGLIEKYRENLLLQSNNFTSWSNIGGTMVGGQSGYDGSNDAYLFTMSSGANICSQTNTQSGVQTYSVYAKGNVNNGLRFYAFGTSNVFAYFDLNIGAVESTNQVIDANIEDKGNGWYRCSMTFNQTNTQIYMYLSNNNNTNASSGSILIQNAQLESGLAATDVLTSGATTGKAGVLVDLPRINFDANGENGSLLLEPSRKNLVAFSEYLNGGIWIKAGCSVIDNDSTSPEGLTNAAKVEGGGGNTQIRLYDNYTFPSAGDYTLSVFAKAGNNNFLSLRFSGVTGAAVAYFDLVNGTTEQSWATIEPVGTDGWHRCSITADLTGPDLTGNYNFYVAYSYTDSTFPSNGDANGQYVYLYGAMLEQNATYATSYIPNHSGTGGVTRAADSCLGAGDVNTFNSSEGVLYTEISALENDQTNRAICIYKDSSLDNIIVIQYSSVSQNIRYLYRQGVTSIADINFVVSDITSVHKIAGSWENNNFRLFVDGIKVGEQLSGNVAPANTFITLGFNRPDGQTFFGNAKQVAVFNEALSDSELATLTTL